jgi:hypothetical protein
MRILDVVWMVAAIAVPVLAVVIYVLWRRSGGESGADQDVLLTRGRKVIVTRREE